MVARTSEHESAKVQRQRSKLWSVLSFWLLGTNFMITAEEADMTTGLKREDAAAKGKGIVCFLCLRLNGLNSS